MAGYQKEILPSSWSPIAKYNVYNINSEVIETSVRSKHSQHKCRKCKHFLMRRMSSVTVHVLFKLLSNYL